MMSSTQATDIENGSVEDSFADVHAPPTLDDDSFADVAAPSMLDDDDEVKVHDQLPSVEEYKSHMNGTSSPAHTADITADLEAEEGNQLPSVEEYKAGVSPPPDLSTGQKCLRLTALLLFFVAIVLVCTLPAILLQKNKVVAANSVSGATSGSTSSAYSGTSSYSGASASGSSGASSSTTETSRYDQVLLYLSSQGISTDLSLSTPGTPQYEAAKWIAENDEYAMDVPADGTPKYNRFVERYALAVLYHATNGTGWKYDLSFLAPVDTCMWFSDFLTGDGNYLRLGVNTCVEVEPSSETTGGQLVTTVGLPLNDLKGQIPDEIQYLHRLEMFSAPFNGELTGRLTNGFQKLNFLNDLELQYCALTGTFPDWIGTMVALTNLGLSNNMLTGRIPDSLFQLTGLELLGFDDNALEADIQSFGALKNLKYLYIEDNWITGTLSSELLSQWKNMVELDMSTNKLDPGDLPSNIFSLPNLVVLDIHANSFQGGIPDIPNTNVKLELVSLYDNNLVGTIPTTINNLQNLRHFDVAINQLSLPFPTEMGSLIRLRNLYTGSNNFGDHDIPEFLGKLTRLRELSMKNNSLTGTIPTFLASLTSLQLLDLDMNKLRGTIPPEIGLLGGLDHLLLNRNQLTGTLPSTMGLLRDLDLFLIDKNEITGNADVLCANPGIQLSYFVADCSGPNPEIDCACCNLCCNDNNVTCNNYDWTVDLDPIWEYGFVRNVYQFGQELLPNP